MAVRDPVVAVVARDRVIGEAQVRAAEAMLGHAFARPGLIAEALTHRSAAQGHRRRGKGERRGIGSNERLEFIGDRVLGLVVAEWLIERFPEEQEGELGRRFAQLVSRPVLAGVAERLGLAGVLALAPNEVRAGVGQLANTLADAMEAALGALYLDAGLEPARRFVREVWGGGDGGAGLSADGPEDGVAGVVDGAGGGLAGLCGGGGDGAFACAVVRGGGDGWGSERGGGWLGASGTRSGWRRRRCWVCWRRGGWDEFAVRVRGDRGGAECGEVDAVEPADGGEAFDRESEGADDAVPGVGDFDAGGESQILAGGYAGDFRAAAEVGPGDGPGGLEWGGGCGFDAAAGGCAGGGAGEDVRAIATALAARGRRVWLVLNKLDLVSPQQLLPLTAALNAIVAFEATFMVSAVTGDGLDTLLDRLEGAVPEGPHLYPDDDLTDLPDRLLAAEIVREQIFLQIHEEVPYGTTVETESWTERPDGSVRVDATVYVSRVGHKAILIGAGGARIREIGARARAQLSTLLERTVHLSLNVKERAGWDEEGARLRALGLDDKD